MKPFARNIPKMSKEARRWQEMGHASMESGPLIPSPRSWVEVFEAETEPIRPVRRRRQYAIPRSD